MKLPRLLKSFVSSKTETSDELMIASPVVSRGKIRVSQDISIDSKHSGSITTPGYLVIGANAVINGSITARSIDTQGETKGNLSASDSLSIRPSATVKNARIETKRLDISPGSQIIDVNITTI